jgi:anti-sigma factor RsiW
MNHEATLRIQAWVDGELPSAAAGEVADWIQRDRAAEALATELRHTRGALQVGEPEYPTPASREFYWSGIERGIRRIEAPESVRPQVRSFGWLRRFLVPAGILAVLALVLAVPVLRGKLGTPPVWASEIESPLDDIGSVTFRSESEGMTVVWVNTR